MTVRIDDAVRDEMLRLWRRAYTLTQVAEAVGLDYSRVRREILRAAEAKLVCEGWTVKQVANEFRLREDKVQKLVDDRRGKGRSAKVAKAEEPVDDVQAGILSLRAAGWPDERIGALLGMPESSVEQVKAKVRGAKPGPKVTPAPGPVSWDGEKDEIDDEVMDEILSRRKDKWGYARIGERVGFPAKVVHRAIVDEVEEKLVRHGWTVQQVDVYNIHAEDVSKMVAGWSLADMTDEFADNRKKVMAML